MFGFFVLAFIEGNVLRNHLVDLRGHLFRKLLSDHPSVNEYHEKEKNNQDQNDNEHNQCDAVSS